MLNAILCKYFRDATHNILLVSCENRYCLYSLTSSSFTSTSNKSSIFKKCGEVAVRLISVCSPFAYGRWDAPNSPSKLSRCFLHEQHYLYMVNNFMFAIFTSAKIVIYFQLCSILTK